MISLKIYKKNPRKLLVSKPHSNYTIIYIILCSIKKRIHKSNTVKIPNYKIKFKEKKKKLHLQKKLMFVIIFLLYNRSVLRQIRA